MKAVLLAISLLLFYPACGVSHSSDNENVLVESETGARYPAGVTFVSDGIEYRLSATGVAVRRKFWLKIYSIAHYLEEGPKATRAKVLANIMSNDTAKQVTLTFARDLRADQVRDGFLESFTQQASAEEMRETTAPLRQFLQPVQQDVLQHDRFVVRWLPDGRLVSIYNEKVVSSISSRTFARVFWSIWFGNAPIVDRHQLIAFRLLPGDERSKREPKMKSRNS